jgi:hypothetical protein
MKKKYLLIPYCVLLLSCSPQKEKEYAVIDLGSSLNTDRSNDLSLNDISEKIEIIPVVTTDSTLLQYIFFADVMDDKIIAYDKETLFSINKADGNINKIIDKRGAGPEEYQAIMNVIVDHNILNLYDPGKRGFLKYDFSGKFIDFFRNDSIATFKPLTSDGNYAVCYSPLFKSDNFVGIYDKDWNYVRGGVKNDRRDKHLAMLYFNGINTYNGKLFFMDAFGDTLYQMTTEKDIPYLVLNKGKYKMPIETAATLDMLNKEGPKYIELGHFTIASKYCFMFYYYDNKHYYDIWDFENSKLLYRNIVKSERESPGIPVKINNKTIHIWVDYAKNNYIYCIVNPEDALKLIPSLPEDTNPIILEVKLK